MTKLIFGCGYLGERVARNWRMAGEEVAVVSRSSERAACLRASGYRPVVADVTDVASLQGLPPADTLFFAVGYDRRQSASIHEVYVDGLRNVLQNLPRSVRRFVYVSSTGVYGQTDGDWVDEQAECRPVTAGGQACLAAEDSLRAHPIGSQSVILRLAGIYGPGRIPRRADVVAGRSIAADARGVLNLIHVDDAARIAVAAAAAAGMEGDTYNVSDGQPVLREDFYRELARLQKAPTPHFSPPDPHGSQRGRSNKRIRNRRLLTRLNGDFLFPSYREGLAAIVQDEDDRDVT